MTIILFLCIIPIQNISKTQIYYFINIRKETSQRERQLGDGKIDFHNVNWNPFILITKQLLESKNCDKLRYSAKHTEAD